MSAHTPGPWVVTDDSEHGCCFEFAVEADSDGKHICDANGADARLIAAAPELLAALKECLESEERRRRDLKDGSPASSYSDARLARVRAAIAKAEGREPTRKPTEQERLEEAKAKHEDAMLERRRGL